MDNSIILLATCAFIAIGICWLLDRISDIFAKLENS